jgi:hypothetical protein
MDGSGLDEAPPFPGGASGWFSVRPAGVVCLSFPVLAFQSTVPPVGAPQSVALVIWFTSEYCSSRSRMDVAACRSTVSTTIRSTAGSRSGTSSRVPLGSTTRRAASVPGKSRTLTAAKGGRSASGLARTLTTLVPGRDRAVTGTRSRLAQRSSDDREIPSRRQNSPDVPLQPRNRTNRSRHSARHSALNRRSPEPEPGATPRKPVRVRARSRVVMVGAYERPGSKTASASPEKPLFRSTVRVGPESAMAIFLAAPGNRHRRNRPCPKTWTCPLKYVRPYLLHSDYP